MKPESICSLILSASFIVNKNETDDMSWFVPISDFLKIDQAMKNQKVNFGHFQIIVDHTSYSIQEDFKRYSSLFISNNIEFISQMKTVQKEYEVNAESPLGIIFADNLHQLDSIPIFLLPKIKENYETWLSNTKNKLHYLTLLLNPDFVFHQKPIPKIFSPLPSYITPSNEPTDDEFIEMMKEESESNPQAFLYLAMKHAEQRKTSLAVDEVSQLCLKMTRSSDETVRSRAAVTLAQVYDMLGIKSDSILALNESIDTAKSLPDPFILSSAVAMKAKVNGSDELWKHAASLSNPHPQAVVKSLLDQNGTISDALKKPYPYVAAHVYAESDRDDSYIFAKALQPSIRLLPTVIEPLAKKHEWKEAATIIKSFDISFAEVRATAIAVALLYYHSIQCNELVEEYQTQLNEVLSIDAGNFNDVKTIIQRIANLKETNEQKEAESPLLTENVEDVIEYLSNLEE